MKWIFLVNVTRSFFIRTDDWLHWKEIWLLNLMSQQARMMTYIMVLGSVGTFSNWIEIALAFYATLHFHRHITLGWTKSAEKTCWPAFTLPNKQGLAVFSTAEFYSFIFVASMMQPKIDFVLKFISIELWIDFVRHEIQPRWYGHPIYLDIMVNFHTWPMPHWTRIAWILPWH